MQQSFGFDGADLLEWSERLDLAFGRAGQLVERTPIAQLVKSMIGSRTKDAISLAAYERLKKRWPSPDALARAECRDVEKIISDVTFAERKAGQLVAALRAIERERPDFQLQFLGAMPLQRALAWLERLPGVGRKVAAATLNASTLRLPVFIVDSHVHRVLQRLGYIGPGASAAAASEAVTSALGWTGDDLLSLFLQMKRLGQTVCRFKDANCRGCPLRAGCPTSAWPHWRRKMALPPHPSRIEAATATSP